MAGPVRRALQPVSDGEGGIDPGVGGRGRAGLAWPSTSQRQGGRDSPRGWRLGPDRFGAGLYRSAMEGWVVAWWCVAGARPVAGPVATAGGGGGAGRLGSARCRVGGSGGGVRAVDGGCGPGRGHGHGRHVPLASFPHLPLASAGRFCWWPFGLPPLGLRSADYPPSGTSRSALWPRFPAMDPLGLRPSLPAMAPPRPPPQFRGSGVGHQALGSRSFDQAWARR